MLGKNKIDKNLKKYIEEHSSKGYSKHAIKKVLVEHGYHEPYIDGLLRKHSEIQFVKRYAAAASLLFIISIFAFKIIPFNIVNIQYQNQKITGYASISSINEGCCTSVCQQTSENECYGKFAKGKKCSELEDCNVGCCIDREGYCLTNYLYGNCINGYGKSINRDCNDIIFCRNITDKSYSARQYSIKSSKGAGMPELKPNADYYKSSFNIRYYLYDATNILSVSAAIKDNAKDNASFIDTIILYDDGYHNDGAKNDNLYGNNWDSSRAKNFEGFKKLDIDIIIKFKDSTQQTISNIDSIILLNNNKCLPIYTEWGSSKEHSIVIAANNYESLSGGYQKFENDAQNILSQLFSVDSFSSNKGKFNVYRFEQSLSYFNIPTLISAVSSSCPPYSNKKDLLIVLDSSEDYCVSEAPRTFRLNPAVLFYNNITKFGIDGIFSDFCSFVATPKQFSDLIINFAMPPKITVYTFDNITYNNGDINFSYSISSQNFPVNSTVFIENEMIAQKIANDERIETIRLNLSNGTNALFISASDRNYNTAFAQLYLNVSENRSSFG